MELVFGGIMVVGVVYLLLTILGGFSEVFDLGVDDAMDSIGLSDVFGMDTGAGDATGLGCAVLSAFMAGFGALGLVGVSAEWSLIITVLLALSFGWLLGRGTARVMRFVLAQQGTAVYASDDLIGAIARVTIETPPGKTGEAMIEQDQVLKVAVREVNDAALHRGDHVEVIDVDGSVLRVKKKRG